MKKEYTGDIHSSELLAMTECALDGLMPGWRQMPPTLRQWIKDGLMIDMHKAYSNSRYARTAMEDDGET
jgi:hypothetical protein